MTLTTVPWAKPYIGAYPNYPMLLAPGGRGRGASISFGVLGVKAMLQYGHNVLVGREHQKSVAQSNINLIKKIIRGSKYAKYFDLSMKNEIKCVSTGAVCNFKGIRLSLDDWRSLSDYQLIWLEEPHEVTDDQLDVILPSLREPGITLLASWNPLYHNSPIERLRTFEDAHVAFKTYKDNPYFPPELERIRAWDEKYQKPEIYNWIWGGEFRPYAEDSYFPPELVHRAFKEPEEFSKEGRIAGLDIAGSTNGDYTALVILDNKSQEVWSGRIREPDLRKRVIWTYKHLREHNCRSVLVDCTGGRGEADVDALQEMDMYAEPFIFTRASKPRILDQLHMRLADDELTLDNPILKDELLFLGETGEALTGHDDLVMALALAVENKTPELYVKIW